MLTESPARVVCPCGKRLKVPAHLLGRSLRCKACGTRIETEAPAEEEVEAPAQRPPAPRRRPVRRGRRRPRRTPAGSSSFLGSMWRAFKLRLIVAGVVLVIASVGAFLSGDFSGKSGTWRAPGVGIALDYPRGWEVATNDHDVPFLRNLHAGLDPQINLFSEPLQPGLELWMLEENALASLSDQGLEYESSRLYEQAGTSMVDVVYHARDEHGKLCTFRELLLVRGGSLITVSASAPKVKWYRWEKPFDTILKTVRLL